MSGFYQIDTQLMRAAYITCKSSGVSEEISPLDKFVYVYMRNKYLYFLGNQGRMCESLETIASACGLGRTSTFKSVSKWSKIGVIVKDTRRDLTGNRITFYTVNDLTQYLLKS